MNKVKKVILLGMAMTFLITGLIAPQELKTGAIKGKVIDDMGTPLPGVTITLSGPSMMGTFTVTSDSDGIFRIPMIPPGSNYELRAELPGFETVIRKGIIINVGKTIYIEIQMKPSEIEHEVVVTAPSPTVDVAKSGTSTVISGDTLTSLPFTRNLTSVFKAVPGVVGTTIYGSGRGEFGSMIEGIQAGDSDIGPTLLGWDTPMAWDMVEEVEIITAGASAQYYGAGFGMINIVTKSGGNEFSGEASVYYTNEDLTGVHIPEPALTVLNLARPSTPVYDVDASLAVGGPIIKDKIWFMGEVRYLRSKRSGDFRPTIINGKRYDNYDRPFPSYVAYFKLTAQPAKNIRLSLMTHFAMSDVPYYYGGWWRTHEANKHNKPVRAYYNGSVSWFIDNSTILDLRAGGVYFKWQGLYTKEANPDGPSFIDLYTGYQWGNCGPQEYTYKPRVNIALTLTKFIDDFFGADHEFKLGFDWEKYRGDWGFYMKQPLFWYYYNGSPYYYRAIYGGTHPVYGDGLLEYLAIGAEYGSSYETGSVRRFGGFIQDSIDFKRFTLNIGVRADTLKAWVPGRTKGAAVDPIALAIGETIFKPVYGFNPYDEITYETWDNAFPYGVFISPRLGLTFDLFGTGKTVLKLSFTHQAENFPTGTFSGMYPLTWRSFTFNWWDLNNNGKPDLPGIDHYEEAYGQSPLPMVSKAYLEAIDPDVKVPYINEYTVSLEHELFKDFLLSIRYVRKERKRVLGSVLYDKQSGRYWYKYELAPEWWIPFTTIVPAYKDFPAKKVTLYFLSENAPPTYYRLTNIPEGTTKYNGVEISFEKRMSHGWHLGGSITISKSKGNYPVTWATFTTLYALSHANAFVNSYGELPYSRPLVIKLYGTFKFPYDFIFSFFYQHNDGTAWGRSVTVYPPEEWAKTHRVKSIGYNILAEPRGTRRNEATDSLDVRIEKDFKLGPGILGVYVDIFNVLGMYTLTVASNPGGIWRPVDENTTEGVYVPGSTGLRGYNGARTVRFSILYKF